LRVKRECYSLGRWKGQTEESMGVGRSRGAKLLRIIATNGGDLPERVRDPCRLVPFPAVRHRREIRRIGLDQKAIARHHPNEFVVSPLLERDYTAEGDIPTGGDRKFCQRVRTRVAVQDSNHSAAACLSYCGARIVFGITSMDDYRTPGLVRERDLRGECSPLRLARGVVIVIVEAALTYRNRTLLQKGPQLWDVAVCVETRGVVRMNARSRENEPPVFRGVVGCHRGCIDRLTDADDGGRARDAGAGDYRVAVAGERCVREVGVAVDEACRAPVLRGHLRSIQRRTGAAT
jgi:hypothetical protein